MKRGDIKKLTPARLSISASSPYLIRGKEDGNFVHWLNAEEDFIAVE